MEPFYIRQTAELMTASEKRAWFEACAAEAKSEGAQLGRATIDPAHSERLLFEAWKGTAREVGDQGEPRWMLTESKS